MKLSIIIPVFNEVSTLQEIRKRLEGVDFSPHSSELIFVDDGSTDGSIALLRSFEPKHRVLCHVQNRGKGAALRTGLAAATGEIVAIQDADLEYNPHDLKTMLDTLVRENLQVLYGSRILQKQNKAHASLAAYCGGRVLTLITNLLYRTKITDEPTCYKMFRRNLIQSLNLICEKFEFCPEVTAKIARLGIGIPEIPIHYNPRSVSEGKKIRFRDFVEAVRVLWNLRPR